MTTVAIAESKIKLAYREKYLTDGVNERALATPRGAYRGYWLAPRPSPDTWLMLQRDPKGTARDPDQFAVYGHRDDGTGVGGFCVSVRETTDVEFDCADLFPVVAPTESWYVYIEAAYSPNTPTTANYRVEKTDPHEVASPNYNPDAVILGVLAMSLGDTAIDFNALADGDFLPPSGIYERRTQPGPTPCEAEGDWTARKELWGLADALMRWTIGSGAEGRDFAEPISTLHTLTTATKIPLSGEYYVGTTNATDTAGAYFRVFANGEGFSTLTGNELGRIYSGSVVLCSDGITPLNPSVHADAQGFYQNPYLQLYFSDCPGQTSYTGTVKVLGFKRKRLIELETKPTAFPFAGMSKYFHSSDVAAKHQHLTPSSITGATVTLQLLELLTHINERIETVHYDSTPGDWVLLWRSHNVNSNPFVTKDTLSIYFGDQGYLILSGGYIDGAGDVVAGTGDNAKNVTALWVHSGEYSAIRLSIREAPSAGTTWDVALDWTTTYEQSDQLFSIIGAPLMPSDNILWWPALKDMFNSIWSDGYYRIMDQTEEVIAGLPRIRQYYKQNGWTISFNCYYDPDTDLWHNDSASYDAFALKFESYGLILFKRHISVLGSWLDTAWEASWRLGMTFDSDSSYACLEVTGELYEIIRFGWVGVCVDADLNCSDICNFRSKRIALSVEATDFTLGDEYENFIGGGDGSFDLTPLSDHIVDIDEWGFRVWDYATGATGTNYWYDAQAIIESD